MDLQALVDTMPLTNLCGVSLVSASAEEVVGTMEWQADRCTIGGTLHGGILMAFADSVGAICGFLNLPAGASTSTIESKTNFLRPVAQGSVHSVTTPVHVGRRTIVLQTVITDDAGQKVALVTQTQSVLA